jgi:hypothetical protein
MNEVESEWWPYRCGIPALGQKGWTKHDCSKLDDVYHVAHVSDACRILEDREIKARLIGDESRLKKTRTSVSWVSANTWAYGSIYGNVQFALHWQDLVKDRRIYWVEAMPGYSPSAYRFLITDRDLDSSKYVQQYDPEHDKGPLRLRDGVWYCNLNRTSEFMLDRNVSLSLCHGVQFINHHPDVCPVHGSSCKDRKRAADSTGAQVLAFVLGRRLQNVVHCFLRTNQHEKVKLGFTVREALEHLFDDLKTGDPNGIIKSAERSQTLLRGAFLLYGSGQSDDARDLADMLSSSALKKNFEIMVREYLKLDDFSLID